jgi:ethanolamine utilization protein EutN
MILARVLGNVVATQKNERYANARVMVCQPVTPEGEEFGATLLALDSVDAGVGDTVLVVQEGWGASTAATGEPGAAIDSAIVGVVDRIDLLAEEGRGRGAAARSASGKSAVTE